MADQYAYSGMPGPSDVAITQERAFVLGPITWYLLKGIVINGTTATDAGNTPTTELRVGLLMSKITATGLHTNYAPDATDGSQIVEGVLWESRRTIDSDGVTVNRPGQIVIAGYVRASDLILLDQQARSQMSNRFIFDDDLGGSGTGVSAVIAKTADYVVTAADNNAIFTNRGATALVNFTLPTIAKGLRFRFYCEDNDGIKITSVVADTLVTHNDDAADSVAFSTTARCIGAGFEVVANDNASKWLVFPFVWNVADDGSTTSKATIVTA